MSDQAHVVGFSGAATMRATIEREFFPDGALPDQIRLLDRIEASLQEQWRAGYRMAEMVGGTEWSNHACLGYAIRAARRLDYSNDATRHLIGKMSTAFDVLSVDAAKRVYEESPY